jgi:prepilin-type N-terminal cleavage/methylation domain-containing protein
MRTYRHVKANHTQLGFTLIELSIVLVIIGLIAGGVMLGKDLVEQAELRSAISDITHYTSAINQFKRKFSALPGDMRNATRFWGAANVTPAVCATTVGSGTQTCNGNGNGWIALGGSAAEEYEKFRFWQHLANAGIIEGAYSGVTGPNGTSEGVIGVNVPASRIQGAGYFIDHQGTVLPGNTVWFPARYDNFLQFGAYSGSGLIGRILKPEQALFIDSKLDNGLPHTGIVISSPNTRPATPDCTLGANGGTQYNLAYGIAACNLFILLSDTK